MATQDLDKELVDAIATTRKELEAARETIRELANELGDVIDIIEPALAEQVKRLRTARMASLDEIRQIAAAIRELSELLLAPRTEQMLVRAERFLKVLIELEDFRACGALEAVVQTFRMP